MQAYVKRALNDKEEAPPSGDDPEPESKHDAEEKAAVKDAPIAEKVKTPTEPEIERKPEAEEVSEEPATMDAPQTDSPPMSVATPEDWTPAPLHLPVD